MRWGALWILFSVCFFSAFGQDADDRNLYPLPDEEDFRVISSDSILFFAPLGYTSLFDNASRYGFNFVSYDRRGLAGGFMRHFAGDIEITSCGKYPDYAFYSVMREASASYYEEGAVAGGAARYDIGAGGMRDGHSFGAAYSDRRYRAALRYSGAWDAGRGWRYMVRLNKKWGRDAFVKGVFTDALTVSAGAEKRFGNASRLSLFAVAAPVQRAGRSWTTSEAAGLAGDRYYNPAWGRFEGRERSSRADLDFTPMLAAAYEFGPPDGTGYRLSAGWRFGERRRGGLVWYDARNPAPDYYMNLPSYFADAEAADAVAGVWAADENHRQLDWAGIYEANMLSEGGQLYLLADRVERVNDIQAAFSASYRRKEGLRAEWGLRARMRGGNHFRRVKDLLGGQPFADVYQYMIDDEYYSGKRVNDIRNPDRLAGEGDRFGYDYDIMRPGVSAYGNVDYLGGRWNLAARGELSFGALFRRGHYESALFTGSGSYGNSARYAFTTYNIGVSARYSAGVNHHLTARASLREREPEWENVFLSPEYHNFAAKPENSITGGGEVRYEGFFFGALQIEVGAYAVRSARATEILRYYDDLYADYAADNLSGYSIMTMRNVERRHSGFEAALSADLTPRLRLRMTGSLNRYTYGRDPDVEIVADANLTPRLTGARAALKGYVASRSPQSAASVSLRYSSRHRWTFEASWAYAGHRYVEVSPVRRTNRIASLASSPEERTAFARQERLPDASVLDLYVSKGFTLFGMDFFCSLSVSNLLDREITYGGYEQHRIRKEGSGVNRTYTPFPSRYLAAYPRSIYAMLSVNF